MDRVRNVERAVQLAPRCDASMSPSPLSHSLPARCMREPAHACSTTSVDAQRRIALCTTPFTGVGMGASQASKSARVTASVRALSVGSERMRRMVGAGAACAQRRKRSSFEGMACENGRSRSRCARGWAAVLASLHAVLCWLRLTHLLRSAGFARIRAFEQFTARNCWTRVDHVVDDRSASAGRQRLAGVRCPQDGVSDQLWEQTRADQFRSVCHDSHR